MKTWEVMEKLCENPELEFQTTYGSRKIVMRVSEASFYYMDVYNKRGELIEITTAAGGFNGNLKTSLIWELVRKPVSWQEAIQAWLDGKNITVETSDRGILRQSRSFRFGLTNTKKPKLNGFDKKISVDLSGTSRTEEGGGEMKKVNCSMIECIHNSGVGMFCKESEISLDLDSYDWGESASPCLNFKDVTTTEEYQHEYFKRMENPSTKRIEKKKAKGKKLELFGFTFFTEEDTRHNDNYKLTEEQTGLAITIKTLEKNCEKLPDFINAMAPVRELPDFEA